MAGQPEHAVRLQVKIAKTFFSCVQPSQNLPIINIQPNWKKIFSIDSCIAGANQPLPVKIQTVQDSGERTQRSAICVTPKSADNVFCQIDFASIKNLWSLADR